MFEGLVEEEDRKVPTEKRVKATRRGRKKHGEPIKVDENLILNEVQPKTINQSKVFESFESGKHLLLHGSAGTGKTFISIYLALQRILDSKSKHNRITLVRSAVPTRDIGFLPGSTKEKLEVYEAPYQAIFNELFGRADAYQILKLKKIVNFLPTSFVRGTTISNSIIIVDECSNLSGHELDSIITRVGDNSRIIFCGDYSQSDFTRSHEKNGLKGFMSIIDSMKSFDHVEFTEDDIVRSGLVRDYIINKNRLGITF